MHYDFIQSTKDNLRNLINTNYGERLMFPAFGADVHELAWEVGTEDGDIRIMERIKRAVSLFMPYITLDGYEPIRKKQTTGQDKVGVRIFFIIPGFGDTVQGVEIYLNVSG
jgi:phage baseplate assembly protein W